MNKIFKAHAVELQNAINQKRLTGKDAEKAKTVIELLTNDKPKRGRKKIFK